MASAPMGTGAPVKMRACRFPERVSVRPECEPWKRRQAGGPCRHRTRPGVITVLTHEDAPDRYFSTARHEMYTDDPDDTLVLDPVIRHIDQRVAAVIAESEGC